MELELNEQEIIRRNSLNALRGGLAKPARLAQVSRARRRHTV